MWPSPVVALNRAVAVAMVHGPAVALAEVEALEADGRLAGYRYLPATKADLLHRLGRDAEAAAAYQAALALSGNTACRLGGCGRARFRGRSAPRPAPTARSRPRCRTAGLR